MKVGFFLLKFPLSSETFVLNQITAFIDMGFEVEIVALQKATHKTPTWHGLNTTLPPEPAGYRTNLRAKWRNCATEPVRPCAAFIVKIRQALNLKRYGAESWNLILSAICGGSQHRFAPMCSSLILALRGNRSKTTRTGCHSRQNCHYFPRH